MATDRHEIKEGIVDILRPNQTINTDQYNANQQKITQLRELATRMEKTNEEAHRKYIEQELKRRVEEGERARRMLEDLSQQSRNQAQTSHPATSYLAREAQPNNTHIIPTTARIEELPSSSPQASQHVGGSSTRTASAESNVWNDQSRLNYNAQPYNDSQFNNMQRLSGYSQQSGQPTQRPYETFQGRWQSQQTQQLQQTQAQLQWQQQQQQQQQQQHRNLQSYNNLAQAQAAHYARAPVNAPSSQPRISGHTYPGLTSNKQGGAVPVVTTSFSLAGALGQPDPSASSSSSGRSNPTAAVQSNRSSLNQNGMVQGRRPSTAQGRQGNSKDAVAAEIPSRADYVSKVMASAQRSSRTVPTPPTRDNRLAAASHLPSGQANGAQPQQVQSIEKRTTANLRAPGQASTNQTHLASHTSKQHLNNAPVTSTRTAVLPGAPNQTQPRDHAAMIPNGTTGAAVPSFTPTTTVLHPTPITSTHLTSSVSMASYTDLANQKLPDSRVDPQDLGQQNSFMSPTLSKAYISGSSVKDPSTPGNQPTQPGLSPRTPASADKKHLARDILRSLGRSQMLIGKRKRSDELPVAVQDKRGHKKQAVTGTPDTRIAGATSMIQSGQHSHAVDAVAVVAVAAERQEEEEDEDEDEIDLVEDMTSLPPAPPRSVTPSQQHTSLQPSEHVNVDNVDNDDIQNTMLLNPIATPQFPPPSEISPSKAKEPLFLPSSTSPSPNSRQTPSLQYMDDDAVGADNVDIDPAWDMDLDLTMKDWDAPVETLPVLEPTKKTKKRMEVFVLVPPPPNWVKRAKLNVRDVRGRKGRGKKSKQLRSTETSHGLEDGLEEGREKSVTEDEEKRRQDEIVEQATVALTSSLLRQLPCKWRNCNAVMNSVDNLSRHLAQHSPEKPVAGSFTCLWQNCLRRFLQEGKLLAHMETHAQIPVLCPFKDCDEGYRTPKDLIVHFQREHNKDDVYRFRTEPSKPGRTSLPVVPLTLPSYMVIPRDVRQAPISKARHALVGPWVLRNIFGPVSLEVKRQNAAVPLRSVRGALDREDPLPTTAQGHDEYDFLKPISPLSSKAPYFDDLPSEAVSKIVHTGLVFWGPEVDDEKEIEFSGIIDPSESASQHDQAGGDNGRALNDLNLPPTESSTEHLLPSSPFSQIQPNPVQEQTEQLDVEVDNNSYLPT